jgi:DNA helicase-2/ATP-dependent DNA helicase PcrA
VEAEDLLVLTFSRKAQAEFQQRLRRDVPGAEGATVSTFHGWSWLVLRSHWREAGFERRPTILSSEDQQLAIMQDCIL